MVRDGPAMEAERRPESGSAVCPVRPLHVMIEARGRPFCRQHLGENHRPLTGDIEAWGSSMATEEVPLALEETSAKPAPHTRGIAPVKAEYVFRDLPAKLERAW